MHDLIIKNARVADGLGSDLVQVSVTVDNGKISEIGNLSEATRIVDAQGRVLAPGFINVHSHADMVCEFFPELVSDVEQGITTQIAANCGIGAAPFNPERLADCSSVTHMVSVCDFSKTLEVRKTWKDYIESMKARRYGTNLGMLVAHGTLRAYVMGLANRKCTDVELRSMCELLDAALDQGAKGLSFGLEYPPGCYADADEMIALAKVVAKHNAVISSHIRNEDDHLIESVDEMILVAQKSGARTVLSHHKTIYHRNWGKTVQTLEKIEKANAEGADIYCDQYPYLAASTGLKSRIPADLYPMGEEALAAYVVDPKNFVSLRERILGPLSLDDKFAETMIGLSPSHPEFNGRYLIEIAKEKGIDAVRLLLDVLHDDRFTTNGIFTYMTADDVNRVMKNPRVMIGTDGLFIPGTKGAHPRAFGSYPRVLGRYVREEKVLSLPEAIRKMTSLPAAVFNIKNKGRIAVGYDADLVIFDPDTVRDQADFACFDAPNIGIDKVFVGGCEVVSNGKATSLCCGTIVT